MSLDNEQEKKAGNESSDSTNSGDSTGNGSGKNTGRKKSSSRNRRKSSRRRSDRQDTRDTRQSDKNESSKQNGSQEKKRRKSRVVRPDPDQKPVRRVMPDTHSKSILNITNLWVIGILILLIWFVVKLSVIFGIFIFSFVIAFLMYPMVEWLTGRKIWPTKLKLNRVISILIVYLIFGGILFGIGAAIIPALYAQVENLIANIPHWYIQWIDQLEGFQVTLADRGIQQEDLREYLTDAFPTIQNWAVQIGQGLASGVQGAVGGIVSLLIVPIIVFYLLLDSRAIQTNLMNFAPKRTASEIQVLLNRLNAMMNGYLRGLLKLSFIMFVTTSSICLVLGIKNWLLLGVLGGIAEVIPIVGPLLALIPALLVSYFVPSEWGIFSITVFEPGWIRSLVVLACYLSLQYVEGNIWVPRVMGKDLNLHPLTVLFALLAGGAMGGFFGILLSLPIAASLKVIFELYYASFIQRVEDLVRRLPA